MIDLYHHGSFVCAARVRFALGEKNPAWQGHYLDVLKGDQFAARISEAQSQGGGARP
jgi:ganglioside-induced differentiation-associated protein 1